MSNVKQAIPFFWVADLTASLHYYVDGLGFHIADQWIDNGKLRWVLLQLDDVSLMLQEFWTAGINTNKPEGKLGQGISICFLCDNAIAIYKACAAKGIRCDKPFVGNGMWVTSLVDPDGYSIMFESKTDEPEESVYIE